MKETKIALGTWSWGSGAVGGDQVFGNHLELDNLKPVFDAAMKVGLNVWDTATVSGKYDREHPLPAGSDRGEKYNPVLDKIETLTAAMKEIGQHYGASCSQVGIAWAMGKGVVPVIGATKPQHVLEAAETAKIQLTPAEMLKLEVLAESAGIDTRGSWEHTME